MRIYLGLLSLFLVSCGSGTQAPVEPAVQDTTEADVAAITAMMQRLDTAVSSGDVGTLLAMYTDDSVRMGPNEPVEAGIEAIRAGVQEFFDQNTAQLTTVIEDIEVSGDLAFARTSYKQTTTIKESGETSEEVGKWLLVYKRQADGWKIYTEAWSSDSPPPEG